MPVNLVAPKAGALLPVAGVELGTTYAGIRKAERPDIMVMRFAPGTRAAGVFTTNRFCAAPVTVCREHLSSQRGNVPAGEVRGLFINAGNANAGTGAQGLSDARSSCQALAAAWDCDATALLPMSTGVILEPLPIEQLHSALQRVAGELQADNWLAAAQAIMTTDTVPKAVSRRLVLGQAECTITGIAKGAGMIRPNMATMLSVLTTDAAIGSDLLNRWVREAADQSFNRITVDGDTSTNDSFILVATGAGQGRIDDESSPGATELRDAIFALSRELAQAVIRDGEGASKFITVAVEQAATDSEAAAVAYAIAHSPLVKTAFFASDPNLGRLLCAIGYANTPDLDISNVQVLLDDVVVASNGGRDAGYREEDGQRVMSGKEITVTVRLGRGESSTTVWTCDLSHDYVSINADYRS